MTGNKLADHICQLIAAAERRGMTRQQIQAICNHELAKHPRSEAEAAEAALTKALARR